MDYTVIGSIVGLILFPLVTAVLKRWEWSRDLGVPINGVVALATFSAAWWLFDGDRSALLDVWERALVVAFGGSAGISVLRRAGKSGDSGPRLPR